MKRFFSPLVVRKMTLLLAIASMGMVAGAQTKSASQAVLTSSSTSPRQSLAALKKANEQVAAELKPITDAYYDVAKEISTATEEGKDEATINALKAKQEGIKKSMQPFQAKASQINKQILEQYPSSAEAVSILRFSIGMMPLKEGLASYEKLSEEAKKSEAGREIKNQLDAMQAGSPGATAIGFTSTELRGEKLSLSDYRGKYVLLDFWASWCVPCRKGNPHLLDLYAKYKNKGKGLEIIGIASDDGHEDKWKKAVEEDKIGVWKHVLSGLKSDGKGNFDRTNSIADKYGIATLPTKILIDPNGKVIGRYGSGGENDAAMDKKLAEIFGAPQVL